MLAESVTGAVLGGNRGGGGVDTVAICKEEVVAVISGRCIGVEDVVVRDDGADRANGMSLESSSSDCCCCCCCSRLRFFFLRMYHAITPVNIMNATTTGITMVSVRFPLNDD